MEMKNTQHIFPWYKERLQTKYLKASTNKVSSVSSCWRLVNMSLDDFIDGSSIIFHGAPNSSSTRNPGKSVLKEHACFSKQMIQKQIRREYVDAMEEKLKQHPLLVHPHYRDHMTPELFEKVVSVLDPDMCLNSASSLPTPTADHAEEEEEENCAEPRNRDVNKAKQGTTANKIIPDVQNQGPRNPTLQMNGKGLKKGQKVPVNQLNNHKDIKTATKLFRK
ncbi:protein FAM47E [Paralichthys olivaceus]|uniref:protein FAM47E n=1 Tax=Paralichthys olivaceus TaxID=8255 RepID=UPI003751C64A